MKQTISTVYPPPPNHTKTTTTHAQKTPKIEGVSTGLSSWSPTPTPPPPPSFFARQHLKHLNRISLAGRWLLDIV